jgi:murein DD-endopeptidase MepM/ murein hydrolase activator NlpD
VDRGGTIALVGSSMAKATSAIFYGGKGAQDDVTAPITSASANVATAVVPDGARPGPIAAATASDKRSARWSGMVIEPPNPDLRPYTDSTATVPIRAALSKPRKIFYDGLQKAVFAYELGGARGANVQVDAVRLSDRMVVRSWSRQQVQPGQRQRIVWDGTDSKGNVLSTGSYGFRVSTPGASTSANPPAPTPEAVRLLSFKFPILTKKVWYGDGLGAGRGHKGQDVFAKCGTPLVAARGGKVLYAGYHSAAGHYVVIDGRGTGLDMSYMHLRAPALVQEGERVLTGQPIGEVGDTGNAVGCHLHFEMWSAPGWYRGGHPLQPAPELKRWFAAEHRAGADSKRKTRRTRRK